MFRVALMLTAVSFMASIAVADDPASTDLHLAFERMNAQFKDQSQKLGARIEECDAFMKRIQSGGPFRWAASRSALGKCPFRIAYRLRERNLNRLRN